MGLLNRQPWPCWRPCVCSPSSSSALSTPSAVVVKPRAPARPVTARTISAESARLVTVGAGARALPNGHPVRALSLIPLRRRRRGRDLARARCGGEIGGRRPPQSEAGPTLQPSRTIAASLSKTRYSPSRSPVSTRPRRRQYAPPPDAPQLPPRSSTTRPEWPTTSTTMIAAKRQVAVICSGEIGVPEGI